MGKDDENASLFVHVSSERHPHACWLPSVPMETHDRSLPCLWEHKKPVVDAGDPASKRMVPWLELPVLAAESPSATAGPSALHFLMARVLDESLRCMNHVCLPKITDSKLSCEVSGWQHGSSPLRVTGSQCVRVGCLPESC